MTEADFQPLIEWLRIHPNWVLISVFLISLIESLALAGIVVPGVLLLFLVSALASHLDLSIWAVLWCGFFGAIVGDGVSFYLGHYFKDSLRQLWPFSKYPKTLNSGERFFLKHGGKSVMLGRFIGPIRPVLPLIAGMLGMPQGKFTLYNALSAVIWAPFYILPGYLTAKAVHIALPDHFYAVIITLAISLALLAWVFRFLSINLQHNSPLYDAIIVKQENSSFFSFIFRLLTRSAPKELAPKQAQKSTFDSPSPLSNLHKSHISSEFPLASLSLFILSAILFSLWSYLTLKTELLLSLDQFLLAFSVDVRSVYLDTILVHLTLIGNEGFLYASFTILVCTLLVLKRYYTAIHIIIAGLSTAAITHGLKLYFAVPRPDLVTTSPSSFAYPSGHSSGSTVLYGLIASVIAQEVMSTKRWKYYLSFSIPMLLIAFSRVLLGVHWFSDVVGGILLGLIICGLTRVIYSHFWSLESYNRVEQTAQFSRQKKSVLTLSVFVWVIALAIYQFMFFDETLLRFQLLNQH